MHARSDQLWVLQQTVVFSSVRHSIHSIVHQTLPESPSQEISPRVLTKKRPTLSLESAQSLSCDRFSAAAAGAWCSRMCGKMSIGPEMGRGIVWGWQIVLSTAGRKRCYEPSGTPSTFEGGCVFRFWASWDSLERVGLVLGTVFLAQFYLLVVMPGDCWRIERVGIIVGASSMSC
ncbi:hypothetical protein BDU57DRAFT_563116 [Ampelomyces quisqualis]|uniref:Uncharacterized protein n=1 Tax=Ampelomyces quisqualis TaxID=50730 RepID=A0A6A5R5U5_AMPQU|nr:hypothetical protein BDU57DRAFT_563116 [Ampelomyces quisqualis]